MKGYSVYNAIQQLKERGFKKASVARQLNLNRRTVIRYWDMSVEEYEQKHLGLCREKALDTYRGQIIGWLRTYPTLTAAQVCDWLKEHYHEQFAERTVSRYVKALREEYQLKKSVRPRDYEAVPELPMGQQMQVDFGQVSMQNVDGGWTKVYVAAFLLACSRYKYAVRRHASIRTDDTIQSEKYALANIKYFPEQSSGKRLSGKPQFINCAHNHIGINGCFLELST